MVLHQDHRCFIKTLTNLMDIQIFMSFLHKFAKWSSIHNVSSKQKYKALKNLQTKMSGKKNCTLSKVNNLKEADHKLAIGFRENFIH